MATAYQYSKLPPDSIRLLRLQPHRDPTAPIRCTIFDCPLLQTHDRVIFSPYEALSYVWGSTDNPQSIIVRDCPISYDDDDESPATASAKKAGTLSVTRNLHEALVQLRDRFIDRVLWIDAICINQADLDERSCQVASMARIYAIASRVLVWLGPEGDDGVAESLTRCLSIIPIRNHSPGPRKVRIGEWSGTDSSDSQPSEEYESSEEDESSLGEKVPEKDEPLDQGECNSERGSSWCGYQVSEDPGGDYYSWILPIFQRPWFRRIWVLQEVAAARHVLVLCGSVAIDGLALCALIDRLGYVESPEIWAALQSGVNLMKDAFQRNGSGRVGNLPGLATTTSQFGLAISPLAGLLDMYLTRQATDVRDKVYALFGMCSDDLSSSGLAPDYSLPLGKFFDLVCNHLFGMLPISIKTCDNRQVVGMRGRGRVLGQVQRNPRESQQGTYELEIKFKIKGLWSQKGGWRVWAPTVRRGDVFLIVPGARWPMIGRVVGDSLLITAAMASCERMEGITWPGTNASFWTKNVGQKSKWEKRESFWSSDLWLLWDWSGGEPAARPSPELYKDIFPSTDRPARWKSLAVMYWDVGLYESAENAAKAFLEEHFQQETKHTKDDTKEILENNEPATLLDSKKKLEMEFEALVSQLPDSRGKRGLLGLWYLKCHLPPLCAEEGDPLFATAASPKTRFDEFHPHRTYEENLLDQAQTMRDEQPRQSLPSLQRRRSWPLFEKPPAGEPSRGRSASISNHNRTDPGREGRDDNRPREDDLGDECLIAAISDSGHLQTPEDWLWFRLACHRRGQAIRVTPRVLEVLTEPSSFRPRVRQTALHILANIPRDILDVGFEQVPITQEMFNNAQSKANRKLVSTLRLVLERRGEFGRGDRMQKRAEKNSGVLETLEWFRATLDKREVLEEFGRGHDIYKAAQYIWLSRRPKSIGRRIEEKYR